VLETNSTNNSTPGVDIRKYLGLLAREKSFVLVFTFSAVLASLLFTYISSEKYQAATTIFYRPIEMKLLRLKETEAFGAPVPVPPFKVISQTLWDAVQNEVVLRPVVKKLRLDEKVESSNLVWYKRWYDDTKDFVKRQLSNSWALLKYGRIIEEESTVAAIKALRKNIDIGTTKDSYIYVLTVRDKYPERVAKIVDLVGETLVNWLRNEYQNPAKEKLQQLQQQLIDKENEIAFLRDEREKMLDGNKFVSISEETTRGLENLYQMEIDGVQVSAEIEKKQREVNEYEQEIQKRMNVQSKDFKTMKSEKLFGEVELKGLTAKRSFIKTSIQELKEQLQKLPTLQNKLDTLNMKIDSSTREYLHLKDFYTEALTQVASAHGETRVLHPAVIPSKPAQPIKIYHVGLTAFLGLLFSTGLVYILDFLNIKTFFSSQERKYGRLSELSVLPTKLIYTPSFLKDFANSLAANGGSLFLREKNRLVLAQSLDPEHVPSTLPLPLKQGSVFEQAITKKEPILIEDITEKVDVRPSGWDGYKGQSLLVFPMLDNTGEVVGVVSIHDKVTHPFTPEDKKTGLSLLASHKLQITSASANGNIWKRCRAWGRYSIITLVGITIALMVFYLLKRLGY
jgi:uncharacterized protein involved in exopolysaccharide biosynthesis